MRQIVFLVTALIASLHTCGAITSLPHVDIALDHQDPSQVWLPAVHAVLATRTYSQTFLPLFTFANATVFQHLPNSTFSVIGAALEKSNFKFSRELHGVANALREASKTHVSYEYLAAWLYIQELAHTDALPGPNPFSAKCLGLLICTANQYLIHAKNAEHAASAAVRNVTLYIRASLGGSTAFETADYLWFVGGTLSAWRNTSVTMSSNWRSQTLRYADVMSAIQSGVTPQAWVFRSVLSNSLSPTFTDAVKYLNEVVLAAPVYYVVAGTQSSQGVVITRGINETHPQLSVRCDSPWYLVQSNYDHWMPDPVTDPRRTIAEGLLSSFGQNGMGPTTTLGVLDTYPLKNDNTVLSVVMLPMLGVFYAYGQEGTK